MQSNRTLARLFHGEAVELQINLVWDLVNLYRHCAVLCSCVHWWIQVNLWEEEEEDGEVEEEEEEC